MKRSYLFYGEGRNDRKMIEKITEIDQFKYRLGKHSIIFGNSSGGHPSEILKECVKYISGREFNGIICFIDLDKLKEECENTTKGNKNKDWKIEKRLLENKYKEEYNIKIIWHENNLEDEIIKVIPKAVGKGKWEINKMALDNVEKFINSDYWNRLFSLLGL